MPRLSSRFATAAKSLWGSAPNPVLGASQGWVMNRLLRFALNPPPLGVAYCRYKLSTPFAAYPRRFASPVFHGVYDSFSRRLVMDGYPQALNGAYAACEAFWLCAK